MANNFAKFTFKQPSNLSAILKNGAKIIQKYTDETTMYAMVEFARMSVVEAIEYYDRSPEPAVSKNLTGNTRLSFCAAVYHDGTCEDIEVGYKVAGEQKPYHYTFVGDGRFYDRGNGEVVKRVKDYTDDDKYFVDHERYRSSAYYDTMTFLSGHTPKYRKGWTVVVASISPYVELINEWKDLDILESSKEYHKRTLIEAIKRSF